MSLFLSKPFQRIFAPLLFIIILLIGKPADMPEPAFYVVASMAWLALWWMTEAVPIAITSMMPLLLFPLTGVMDLKQTAGFYSSNIIFLFVGGFIIALAMEKWKLHKRIALNIILLTGTNQKQLLLGFIIATAFLSMWISNTATTMMMLPIGISIIDQLAVMISEDQQGRFKGFGKGLILAIAYSASIGGMATIVGTPTNLILVENVQELYQQEMAFDKWIFFALPLIILVLAYLWFHFSFLVFRLPSTKVPGAREILKKEIKSLGTMGYEEKWVLAIFSLVAIAWISRQYLIQPIFPAVNDTVIVLIGAFILFLIPAKSDKTDMVMDWKTSNRLPWEVILLFGGAFAAAGSFQESGLTAWIGEKLSLLRDIPFFVVLLIIVAVVNYLTELTQNMATCTLMIPILAALAMAIDVHPYILMVPMTITASCAFMLPVATAPNAIVFGSGKLEIKDMVRAGFGLNIVSILLISIFTYFFMPEIWGLEIHGIPEIFVLEK